MRPHGFPLAPIRPAQVHLGADVYLRWWVNRRSLGISSAPQIGSCWGRRSGIALVRGLMWMHVALTSAWLTHEASEIRARRSETVVGTKYRPEGTL
jgi:hypothetical protein